MNQAPRPDDNFTPTSASMNQQNWWLTVIHAALALLAPLLILLLTGALSGCNNEVKGEPVNYGPEIQESKVMTAIVNTWRDSYPEKTKEGAFVHFETLQNIAGGTLEVAVSDTGHTVVKRTETADDVELEVVEIKYSYRQGEQAEKLSRQFTLAFAKSEKQTSSPNGEASPETKRPGLDEARFFVKTLVASLRGSAAIKPQLEDPAAPVRQTFHALRTWESKEPPPKKVRETPGCLGIPDCMIQKRHVVFDMVFWDTAEGNRIRIELVTSPDIPQTIGFNMSRVHSYIPGLMKSCVTQMVPIGDDARMRTLVSECQNVISFTYQTAP